MTDKKFIINTSIVLYHTPIEELQKVVHTLLQSNHIGEIFLIDNTEEKDERYGKIEGTEWIWNGKNIGYGAAHNIGIRKSISIDCNLYFVFSFFNTFVPHFGDNFMTNNSWMHAIPQEVLGLNCFTCFIKFFL